MTHIVWDVNPSLFSDFPLFRWYGLTWAVGISLAYTVMTKVYKSENRPIEDLERLALFLIIASILGARIGHILFYDPLYYWNNPLALLPFQFQPDFQFVGIQGLASHGGILGLFIGLSLYIRKCEGAYDYLWILDRLSFSVLLLGGFIRIGNLINSEIGGIPTDVPWAFIFQRIDLVPRHPTQIYEALFYFILSGLLWILWRKKRKKIKPGMLFGLGISILFAFRFCIEFIKENQANFEDHIWINMGQILSIPFILVGLFFVFRKNN